MKKFIGLFLCFFNSHDIEREKITRVELNRRERNMGYRYGGGTCRRCKKWYTTWRSIDTTPG